MARILWQGKGKGKQVWSLGQHHAKTTESAETQELDFIWTKEANDNPDRLLSSDHTNKISIYGDHCVIIGARIANFLNEFE